MRTNAAILAKHKKAIQNMQSIETDQDFNCRDDETSQYSKSIIGRKSKVSQFSKANTNQIESNLNFIENQVNQGYHNKSPFSQAERKSVLSPS